MRADGVVVDRAVVGRFVVLVLLLPAVAWASPALAADSAHYHLLGPGERSGLVATDLVVTTLGTVERDDKIYVDWQMDVTLKEEGKRLAVRAISERAPMTSSRGCGMFLRYMFRLPDGEAFDYRDVKTGDAYLPPVAFRELFLPTADVEPVLIDGFASGGRYLEQVIILDHVTDNVDIEPIENATVLELRPDMLIGTSRNFKDDGTGRPAPTANYNYVEFTEANYDQMIAAGANYFGVKDHQVQWVRHRPVFYRGTTHWPEDYYRSNYVPGPMFSDEPMVRLGWQHETPLQLDHPQQMASYLTSRVRHIYSGFGMRPLGPIAQFLGRSGIHLGPMSREYLLAPTWETELQTAFYELAGGAPGIVHEGRYVEHGYGWHPDDLLGEGLEVTPREMLLCYYAWLRGAARAFDGEWGMSIYGQSDPAMREEALTLAYDLGARYLWFWTSDHDHHMVYTDQLALTRVLVEHAESHPRKDLADLRDDARVGIAVPHGYAISFGNMFNQLCFAPDRTNQTGTAYREVSAAALCEGVLCAKQGISFDFTVQHEGLSDLGYEELRLVGEDARVTTVPNRLTTEPVRPALRIEVGEPDAVESPDAPADAVRVLNAYDQDMTIDGQLAEWADAEWIRQEGEPSGEGEWDGPADFEASIAFAADASFFYVAARVRDDRHHQPFDDWNMWQADSVQIGLDPRNEENVLGYSENQHEIGFALTASGRPVAYRWHGRRGQPQDEMHTVPVAIQRDESEGETIYEAAIPLSELAPFSPLLTPVVGVGIIVNDADAKLRETFHETSPEALSLGKNPKLFRKLSAAAVMPSSGQPAVNARSSASLLWGKMVTRSGDKLTLDCMTRSRGSRDLEITVRLAPLQPLQGAAGKVTGRFTSAGQTLRRTVTITPDTEPGRYHLTISVKDGANAILTRETRTVFIYP